MREMGRLGVNGSNQSIDELPSVGNKVYTRGDGDETENKMKKKKKKGLNTESLSSNNIFPPLELDLMLKEILDKQIGGFIKL